MKKLISVILVIAFAILSCGDSKYITFSDGRREYVRQYGLFDEKKLKRADVEYDVIVGNVVWSILGVETVLIPLFLVGWYLYEPIGVRETKHDNTFSR
jgi:hypothetical protein